MDDLMEEILNKKHLQWRLIVLKQYFSVNTTVAVFCLNPPQVFSENKYDSIKKILKDRGYTRLYILHLFSQIGKFSDFYLKPIDDIVDTKSNNVIKQIIPNVNKIFFAYGEPENEEMRRIINKRVDEVKYIIKSIKEDIKFYYFGDLIDTGYPKELDLITENDLENQF